MFANALEAPEIAARQCECASRPKQHSFTPSGLRADLFIVDETTHGVSRRLLGVALIVMWTTVAVGVAFFVLVKDAERVPLPIVLIPILIGAAAPFLADVRRDPELAGRAVWLWGICVLCYPPLGATVYWLLRVRGRSRSPQATGIAAGPG